MCKPKSATTDEDNSSPLLLPTPNDVATQCIEVALMTANVALHDAKLVREYVATRNLERSIHIFAPMNTDKDTFYILYSKLWNICRLCRYIFEINICPLQSRSSKC